MKLKYSNNSKNILFKDSYSGYIIPITLNFYIMKKYIVLPVIMLLFVATSFAQSSRRSSGKKSTKARTEVKAKRSTSKSRSATAKSRSSSARKSTPQKSKQKAVKRSSSSKSSGKSNARSIISKRNPVKSKSSSRSTTVKRKLPEIIKSNRSSSAKRSSVEVRKDNRSSSNKREAANIRKSVNNNNSKRINTNRTTNDLGTNSRINNNRIAERKAVRKNIAHRTNSGYDRISRKARHKGVWRVNRPLSIEIRRVRYPYRRPGLVNVYWTRNMYRNYAGFYPFHTHWYMDIGSEIETISSYDADYYVGDVKRVYGKVEEVYYSPEDRNYYLFFGAPYPYHDFSVVISRRDAKRLSLFPEWYFNNQHICVTGLITWFEDKPEMIVKSPSQIHRY